LARTRPHTNFTMAAPSPTSLLLYNTLYYHLLPSLSNRRVFAETAAPCADSFVCVCTSPLITHPITHSPSHHPLTFSPTHPLTGMRLSTHAVA
jgi:hypothetical protein